MSGIDERVVSMKFDNKNFESNVAGTMSTLDKLKKALKLDGASKGLTDLEAKSRNFKMDGMLNGAQQVTAKFSAMSVAGMAAIATIASKAVTAGAQIAKSLTIKPVTDGFREYETQMGAIQTIMANTSHRGTTLKQVNAALDELNDYSDKTIYNFTEMTKNIGTFTAAGLDLKTSTSAIKGIANLAAVSGSNSQQASTAMYQLSQALSAGRVSLQDWNSVVNAGMGGKVFQDALLRTAKIHGKSVDDIISGRKKFRESLQDGWLDQKILSETLATFTGDLTAKQLKQMGYSQQQIEQIIKMGKTANDAATKVKTFSQLMETTGEALGSGWAQTWRIIFGDFEEAKGLFTSISDVLTGMIGKASDARNDLLKGWKELGGRQMLIQGLSNVFKGLMSVMRPIQQAFREIFPPTTATQLIGITRAFLEFSKGLRVSDATAQKIKDTFKGFFAIFSIVRTVVVGLAKAFFSLFSGTDKGASGFLNLTAMLGRNISEFDAWLKKTDSVDKFFSAIVGPLKNFAKLIAGAFNAIGDFTFPSSFSEFGKNIQGIARVLFLGDYDGGLMSVSKNSNLVSFLNDVRDSLGSIGDFVGGVGSILFFGELKEGVFGLGKDSKIVDFLFDVREGFMKLGDIVGKIGSGIKTGLSKAFEGASFSDVVGLVFAGLGASIALGVKRMVKSFTQVGDEAGGFLKGLKGTLDDFKGIFSGISDTLAAAQTKLKADALLKIAGAIAIMAGALILLSMINPSKLAAASGAMVGLVVELIGMMKVLEGSFTGMGATKLTAIATALVGVSIAVGILGIAMEKLSGLNWGEIARGLSGLVGILGALAIFLKVGKFGTLGPKAGAGLVVLATSLLIFGSAMKKFGSLNMGEIGKGLLAISGVLGAVALFTKANNPSKMISTGLGLTAIATSMHIFASAMEEFGDLSWTDIVKGLAGMAGSLAAVAGAMQLMPKDMLIRSVALVIVGQALKTFGGVVESMGEMSWTEIAKGLITLAGALTIIGVALYGMSGALPGAAAMLIVAPALLALDKAMRGMGKMSWGEIAKGLTVLAGSLLILAVGLTAMIAALPGALALMAVAPALGILGTVMSGMGGMSWGDIAKSMVALSGALTILAVSLTLMVVALPGAAALIVAATALGILAPVLVVLGSLSWEAIGKGLIALAGALTIIGVAGLLLGPVVPILLGLSVAITLLGAGIALAGAGVLAFSLGITALAAAFAASGTVILAAVKSLLALIPFAMTKLADGIIAFAARIAGGGREFYQAATTALMAIIRAINTVTPQIVGTLVRMVVSFANTLANNAPKLVDAGMRLVIAILQGISNNIGRIVKIGSDIIVNFLTGLQAQMPRIADAGAKTIIAFVRSAAGAIRNNQGAMRSAARELGSAIISGITGGLSDGVGRVVSKAKGIASSAINAAKGALGINSPSKVFIGIGHGIGEGLVMGMEDMHSSVGGAGKAVSMAALKATEGIDFSKQFNIDAAFMEANSTPVITPVVDLSNVRASAATIQGMFGQSSLGALAGANIRDPRYMSANDSVTSQPTQATRPVHIEYNQHNHSPKALSELEIYRQTQNQLEMLKGAMRNQ